MGVRQGVHVLDEAIAGSDALGTSLVLAEAVKKIAGDGGVNGGCGRLTASMTIHRGDANPNSLPYTRYDAPLRKAGRQTCLELDRRQDVTVLLAASRLS